MTDFVAYPSRWRIALLTLAATAFVAIGLWMGGAIGDPPSSRRYSTTFVMVIGWFCVIFFGFCGIAAFRRLFDTSEQLRIGSLGIRWKLWSDQTIPWSEVDDVTTWEFKGQKSIVLHLRDRSRFPGKTSLAALGKANRLLIGGDIAISLTGTDRSFSDALSAIERFRASGSEVSPDASRL